MPVSEESGFLDTLAGGSGVEALGGLAGIILSVLGLVGISPALMVSIAAIVVGGAMLIGGAIASAEVWRGVGGEGRTEKAVAGGGATMAVMCGIAVVVLGVLGLVNIAPAILLPIAAITVGTGLALFAAVPTRGLRGDVGFVEMASFSRMPGAGIGMRMVTGLAAIVLGVLALVGVAPAVLTLVAFLVAAVPMLVGGFSAGSTTTLER